MPDLRRLSVLIVSWNGREHLEVCLPSLLEQGSALDFAVEILVLDNGSNDGTAGWVERAHPEVRLVASEHNLGFAGGNNRLAREATGDALLLINNDTRAEPDLLAAYADVWRSVPGDVAAWAVRNVKPPQEVYAGDDPRWREAIERLGMRDAVEEAGYAAVLPS